MERGPVGVPMKDRARTRVIRRDNDPIMRSKMAVDADVVMIADEYVISLTIKKSAHASNNAWALL